MICCLNHRKHAKDGILLIPSISKSYSTCINHSTGSSQTVSYPRKHNDWWPQMTVVLEELYKTEFSTSTASQSALSATLKANCGTFLAQSCEFVWDDRLSLVSFDYTSIITPCIFHCELQFSSWPMLQNFGSNLCYTLSNKANTEIKCKAWLKRRAPQYSNMTAWGHLQTYWNSSWKARKGP